MVSTVCVCMRFVHRDTYCVGNLRILQTSTNARSIKLLRLQRRAVADHTLDSGGHTGDVSPTIASITNVPSTVIWSPLPPPPPPVSNKQYPGSPSDGYHQHKCPRQQLRGVLAPLPPLAIFSSRVFPLGVCCRQDTTQSYDITAFVHCVPNMFA